MPTTPDASAGGDAAGHPPPSPPAPLFPPHSPGTEEYRRWLATAAWPEVAFATA